MLNSFHQSQEGSDRTSVKHSWSSQEGTPTQGAESLVSAVQPLTQNGVSVVAVGVGPDVDEVELTSMGGKKENAFKISDYDDLQSYVSAVVKDLCEGKVMCPC